MATDTYPQAVQMPLPTYYSFNSNAQLVIVQHSTGGDMTVQDVFNTFMATMRSTHFAIGLDGTVAQFVPLSRGAGGNCCAQQSGYSGYDGPFWNGMVSQFNNLNLCTISVEHCNNSSQSLEMTPAQMDASNKLTLWLCQEFNIGSDHIKGHDSINATNCPGSEFYNTYWQDMINYVNNGLNPQPGGNVHMETQFDNVWYSAGIGDPNSPTGIYLAFKNAFLEQKIAACFPLKMTGPNVNANGELETVDWNGNAISWQSVSTGLHAEDKNGTIMIYDGFSKRIA